MIKNVLPLLAGALLLLFLAACGKQTPASVTGQTETAAAQTGAEFPLPPGEPTDAEGNTTEDGEFNIANAEYLGAIESNIYGSLYIWYADRKLAIYDAYSNRQFLFSSHGYTPEVSGKEVEMIIEDMDFDGETDFGLLYADNDLNRYYDCWLWVKDDRDFVFSEPLSGIPSPSFDKERQTVYSYNRLSAQNAIVTEYQWQSGGLLPVAHRSLDNGGDDIITAPEDVDTPITIFDGLPLSGVTLMGNVNSQSRWLCKIEDETVVALYSNEHNPVNAMFRFTFQGLRPGATTVVLKYATDWDAEAIADRILNILVQPDLTLRIIETES